MQLPFYATKTTVVTREAAIAEGTRLTARPNTTASEDRADLIDFCLSGPKTEKVQLSLGTKVRMKASGDWYYDTPVAGTVCVVSQAVLSAGDEYSELKLNAVSDGDTQRVSFPNHVTDLSEWIEVL